ncbi:MAG: hypothetical protein UZ22_OP11002000340, partial [Microgenomates bacterium OLB23]
MRNHLSTSADFAQQGLVDARRTTRRFLMITYSGGDAVTGRRGRNAFGGG